MCFLSVYYIHQMTEIGCLEHCIQRLQFQQLKKLNFQAVETATMLDLPPPTNLMVFKRVYYQTILSGNVFFCQGGSLLRATCFSLKGSALFAFDELKQELTKASLGVICHRVPFSVETDASGYALSVILSQDGRPVAHTLRVP